MAGLIHYADPDAKNQIPVSAATPLPVTITSETASTDAQATAAAPSYSEGTANPLSQTLTGDLRVIAKQSGTWNIATVTALTAITNALPTGANVLGGVTQSGTWNVTNISGTISLPTGAATAAKQPALGTAGTASADVISVQGIASMTALKVDGSAVTQPVSGTVTAAQATAASLNATVVGTGTFAVQAAQSGTWNIGTLTSLTNALPAGTNVIGVTGVAQASTTSGQSGNLTQGAVTTAAPTYTTAQTSPLSLTTSGALRVDASAATVTVTGTVTANAGTGTLGVQEARGATGTQTSVASSASSVTVLASNASRIGATVYNDSTQILYLLIGSSAASTSVYSVQIPSNGYFELARNYSGQLTGIWASANGNARVTEW